MLSIQQVVKAIRNGLQNSTTASNDLAKSLKHVATANTAITAPTDPTKALASLHCAGSDVPTSLLSQFLSIKQQRRQQTQPPRQTQQTPGGDTSSQLQKRQVNRQTSHSESASVVSDSNEVGSVVESVAAAQYSTTALSPTNSPHLQRSQRIQKFYQQQLHHFHTQHNQSLCAKQKQTKFAMSSLAAEPIALQNQGDCGSSDCRQVSDDEKSSTSSCSSSAASSKPCFNTGLAEILQFMELIGNLKHTKRTGWVLRDVSDCESISGHMYRMSMLTFLLDGSEGLNQIRCMELALVHDLAESLVGDITPFCGVSKEEKRTMEFKAMEDICKLIEPRGKKIMELFEEYEIGESAESKFVKDLDRLDMIMQAFEYEKRDNCLLKHQEFFDSTEGKFKHPFVKKLVNEIYEQRRILAKAKGATPPPRIEVPNMDDPATYANSEKTNGHCLTPKAVVLKKSSSSSSS